MGVSIISTEPYRSKPDVSMNDDMVRVTFTCNKKEWHGIKYFLETGKTIRVKPTPPRYDKVCEEGIAYMNKLIEKGEM